MTIDQLLIPIAGLVGVLLLKRLIGGPKVDKNVVREKIQAGAKIVDVRNPEEFRAGAYPGAVNIPLSQLDNRKAEIPKNCPVVLYCASGMRSAAAARTLKHAGYGEVINAGGLSDMP